MENRVTINICGEEYTFVAQEAPSYMQRVGTYVDEKMNEVLQNAHVGSVETCGALFADPARKASSNYGIGSDGRIALYVEEANRAKNEASELKREIFRLQTQLSKTGHDNQN